MLIMGLLIKDKSYNRKEIALLLVFLYLYLYSAQALHALQNSGLYMTHLTVQLESNSQIIERRRPNDDLDLYQRPLGSFTYHWG